MKSLLRIAFLCFCILCSLPAIELAEQDIDICANSECKNAAIANFFWKIGDAQLQVQLDAAQLRSGILSGKMSYSAANVVLGIGVTEFVPGVNDFNTAPPEKALMPTRRESAYAFGPEKLPERCTIRIAGTKGGKQMFEHRMRYDKRGLLPFDVTNVTATEDFKCLGAEVSLGEDRKGLLFELSLSDDSGKKPYQSWRRPHQKGI